jgi:hypothetical protein
MYQGDYYLLSYESDHLCAVIAFRIGVCPQGFQKSLCKLFNLVSRDNINWAPFGLLDIEKSFRVVQRRVKVQLGLHVS